MKKGLVRSLMVPAYRKRDMRDDLERTKCQATGGHKPAQQTDGKRSTPNRALASQQQEGKQKDTP